MLYNDHLKDFNKEKEEFIFDTLPYNEDIDVRDIAVLEGFYKENGYIPEKYINIFLNYITYYARLTCANGVESPLTSSLKGKCSVTAKINDELLSKIGFNVFQFNVGKLFGDYLVHQAAIVEIPTIINGEIVNKKYLLDPTFRQFCLSEENRYERYFEEPRHAVKMSTPHPGYFLNLTNEGQEFAKNLIHFGYFEINDTNIKLYCDSFALYLTPIEKYNDIDIVGKISTTNIDSDEYLNRIMKSVDKDKFRSGKVIQTPIEYIESERKRLKNRLKYLITHRDEFTSNINIEDEDSLKM